MHNIIKKIKNDEYILSFEGELTIDHIETIKNALTEALSQTKRISLSFVSAQTVDISFYQILCSFHKSAELKGVSFTVSQPIPEFINNTAVILGFSRHATCSIGKLNPCFWITKDVSPGNRDIG